MPAPAAEAAAPAAPQEAEAVKLVTKKAEPKAAKKTPEPVVPEVPVTAPKPVAEKAAPTIAAPKPPAVTPTVPAVTPAVPAAAAPAKPVTKPVEPEKKAPEEPKKAEVKPQPTGPAAFVVSVEDKNKEADTAYLEWLRGDPSSFLSPALRKVLNDKAITYLVDESRLPFNKYWDENVLNQKIQLVMQEFMKKFGPRVNKRELQSRGKKDTYTGTPFSGGSGKARRAQSSL